MSSGSRWKKWCRNGCGKKVVYIGITSNILNNFRYKCEECGEEYENKEEVLRDA